MRPRPDQLSNRELCRRTQALRRQLAIAGRRIAAAEREIEDLTHGNAFDARRIARERAALSAYLDGPEHEHDLLLVLRELAEAVLDDSDARTRLLDALDDRRHRLSREHGLPDPADTDRRRLYPVPDTARYHDARIVAGVKRGAGLPLHGPRSPEAYRAWSR